AYQAQDADRQHREAAEAALRDYTELAADQWLNEFQPNLINGITGVWVAIKGGALIDDASALTPDQIDSLLPDSTLCRCLTGEEVLAKVYFETPGQKLISSRVLIEDDYEQFWHYLNTGDFARLSGRWSGAWFLVADGDNASVFSVLAEMDEANQPIRGVAYQLEPEAVARMADFLYESRPLLFGNSPKALPNATLFDVVLSTPKGRQIHSTVDDTPSRFATDRTLSPVAGSFVMSVSLKPAAPDLLIPGGMPRPRLPFLLLLLGVTGAALVAALVVLRRESELMKLRSDFVSSVSHELRTPLAQIRMFTETLLLGRVRSDVERRRALEIIDQEARRLASLVENVLTFGRGAERRMRVTPQPTSFAEEVQRIADSFAELRQAQSADVRLELQEDIVVPVDRDALRQIMVNLVDNALKYGPAGQRVTIGTALFDDAARVWVDDEGPGVPEPERERVFESFQRLSRDLEKSVTGSGIGLSVVRELVRMHGGRTWIEEAPGGGARVVAEFPGAYVRGAESARDWAVA
ncbi:MAG TPA: HAMP domain-containing sensor histidine kinase, partial [Longimicrobiales bacterium]|nr:HAMP domain-containing sensor histidine kinase [Longimicrobiales bacterium]